jgi:hypothetical protein
MALRNDAIVRVANELNGGIAVLNGTTIGTLGSNTNGVTIETAGSFGTRIISLIASSDNSAAVDVFLYILRGGSTVVPIGQVNVPINAGNTSGSATRVVDFLNGTNIPGLPLDNTGRQYIPLAAGDVLRATTFANLVAGRSCYITAFAQDFVAP